MIGVNLQPKTGNGIGTSKRAEALKEKKILTSELIFYDRSQFLSSFSDFKHTGSEWISYHTSICNCIPTLPQPSIMAQNNGINIRTVMARISETVVNLTDVSIRLFVDMWNIKCLPAHSFGNHGEHLYYRHNMHRTHTQSCQTHYNSHYKYECLPTSNANAPLHAYKRSYKSSQTTNYIYHACRGYDWWARPWTAPVPHSGEMGN